MNCYILTGGRSTRMGRSKTDMFLPAVASAARPVFDNVFAVQRADGGSLPIPTIFEPQHADDGPVFGVLRALEHAQGRCFILAVDYPKITSPVLLELRGRVEHSLASLVVPLWKGIPQMLCAGYSPDVAVIIRRRLTQRNFDLTGLIESVASQTFTMNAPELMNVNTTADLEQPEKLR